MSRKAKRVVVSNVNSKRLEHSLSLPTQGKLFKLVDTNASTIWAKACQSLPFAQMKFALNASSDTLPHNANLALWRKNEHLSAACKLCGERQTLCHILNNCEVALELRRYTVEPPNKGHFGNGSLVLCSEVVPISEVQSILIVLSLTS